MGLNLIRLANVRIVVDSVWHLTKQISIGYREPYLLIGWSNCVSSIKAFSDHAIDHYSIEYQVTSEQSATTIRLQNKKRNGVTLTAHPPGPK